jgi:glucan-binding YG repeat protein
VNKNLQLDGEKYQETVKLIARLKYHLMNEVIEETCRSQHELTPRLQEKTLEERVKIIMSESMESTNPQETTESTRKRRGVTLSIEDSEVEESLLKRKRKVTKKQYEKDKKRKNVPKKEGTSKRQRKMETDATTKEINQERRKKRPVKSPHLQKAASPSLHGVVAFV